jgi:hypothetical protein
MTMALSLIVDSRYKEYTLKDGRRFVIDNYRDAILRDGYSHLPPKRKSLWKKTVKDLIDNEFKGNIKEASEVLYEVYQRPEYLRGNLYKYIYTRQREDRRNKKLKKLMEYIYREGLVEEVKKELWKKESVGIESEQLGSSQCDFQLKKFKRVNSMEKCQRC